MTEDEYRAIAAACDRLLRGPGTSLERLAIPMLHVVNEHPRIIESLATLTADAAAVHKPRALVGCARATVSASRSLAASFLQTSAGPECPDAASPQVDVVIVSRLGHQSQLDQEEDFYFGVLQKLLRERGATSKLVFVDHLERGLLGHSRSLPVYPEARCVLPRAVSPRIELQIWQRCIKAWQELRRSADSSGNLLDAAVASLASGSALAAPTLANLRLNQSVSAICRVLQPAMVVTTYEGGASERMIWHGARSGGRRPLCVGYQHTRLTLRAHAIRRSVKAPGIDCDPDVVLTLGEISHQALAASPGLNRVQLIPYGSHRHAANTNAPLSGTRPAACLVLPDGNERECVILFTFAIACARANPGLHFLLRPHPNVRFESLRLRHPPLRELPDNVKLSAEATLEQECARVRYCLYRGSSAALSAVAAGVKPFYLAQPGELAFDPLFALSDWREVVTTLDEFSARVRIADSSWRLENARTAASFCRRYVAEVRPQAVDQLLALAAESRNRSRNAATESSG